MINNGPRRNLLVLGLAVFILVPSFDTIAKYFGPAAVALYFVFGLVAVYAGYFLLLPYFLNHTSERAATFLAIATFIGLIVIVSIGYPLANSGRFGGGSDVDDAMIMAVRELVSGNYPYYQKTYLGLSISPMPGALLLSIPWVLSGSLEYQNIFWLAVLYLVLRHALQSNVSSLALFWAMLALSPTLHQGLVTGSDYIANTIYVLVPTWVLLKWAGDDRVPRWKKLLPAVFLGLALSSRSNFLIVLPMAFLALARIVGWKEAFKYSAAAAAVFALVTLPFWAWDPGGFSPALAQATKVVVLEEVMPLAGIIIPASGLFVAVVLSLRENATNIATFFQNVGLVQLYLLLFMSALYGIRANQLNLYMGTSGYGLFALFFGAVGCWLLLNEGKGVPAVSEPELSTPP